MREKRALATALDPNNVVMTNFLQSARTVAPEHTEEGKMARRTATSAYFESVNQRIIYFC